MSICRKLPLPLLIGVINPQNDKIYYIIHTGTSEKLYLSSNQSIKLFSAKNNGIIQ